MAQHACAYQLGFARESGGSAFPQSTVRRVAVNDLLWDNADLADVSVPIPMGVMGPNPANNMVPIIAVDGILRIGDADPWLSLRTETSRFGDPATYWIVQGAYQDNLGLDPVVYSVGVIEDGRMNQRARLRIRGDAQTAVGGAGTNPAFNGNVYFVDTWYTNSLAIVEFEDSPPSVAGDSMGQTSRVLERIKDAPGQATLPSGEEVPGCAFTAVSPQGAVFIRAEDIGVGNGQIPPDVATNTADRFRNHPSVFIRRNENCRQVTRMKRDGISVSATLSEQPFRIRVVTAASTISYWLISVDGVTSIVTLEHDASLDLRRPKDIWKQVWLPLIAGSQSPYARVALSNQFGINNAVAVDRLRYLEYAACAGLQSFEGDDIVQTGSTPPGPS